MFGNDLAPPALQRKHVDPEALATQVDFDVQLRGPAAARLRRVQAHWSEQIGNHTFAAGVLPPRVYSTPTQGM